MNSTALSITQPPRSAPAWQIERPGPELAVAVHRLIAACPPLDRNSLYCNLLQCSHFRETSAVARRGHQVVGFVSGYRLPTAAACLFIWQVAVAEQARGGGLGRQLIHHILARRQSRDLRYIRTTITARNSPSWAMFHALARELGAATSERPLFVAERHFDGIHDTEYELAIGPFDPVS